MAGARRPACAFGHEGADGAAGRGWKLGQGKNAPLPWPGRAPEAPARPPGVVALRTPLDHPSSACPAIPRVVSRVKMRRGDGRQANADALERSVRRRPGRCGMSAKARERPEEDAPWAEDERSSAVRLRSRERPNQHRARRRSGFRDEGRNASVDGDGEWDAPKTA
jgi:hypothetical protein